MIAYEIIKHNDMFYMVYVTDKHLAIAKSRSPLVPFIQDKEEYLDEAEFDDDILKINGPTF